MATPSGTQLTQASARGVCRVDDEARLPLSCHGAWGPVTNTQPW